MLFTSALLFASAAVASPLVKRSGGQVPFKFPLANGFPNPSASALKQIELAAQGTLPNTPLPKSITPTSALVWSLIAENEIFEVAYFTSLIANITNKVPGYESSDPAVLPALQAIVAQEQLHALGANAVLTTSGHPAVQPCEYIFPVDNLADALALASTFTDLVLGTLQTALTSFGMDQDTEFLGLVGAVIGQEGEQDGFFRYKGGKIPSALPFLTVGGPAFANSALTQNFILPGSCPTPVGLPVLPVLSVSPKVISAKTQTITFTYPGTSYAGHKLAYINQQNKPLVYPITKASVNNGMISFTTVFQYDDNELNGLTIASIVTGSPQTAADVGNAAIAGPALIEIN